MRIAKSEIPAKIDTDAAEARQKTDFGDASECTAMGGEYFRMDAGVDLAPLLEGLENDHCQSPHWGYVIGGELTVSYQSGSSEKARTGDLIYWPPGHTVRADTDSEFVLFSPAHEHGQVLDHVKSRLDQ